MRGCSAVSVVGRDGTSGVLAHKPRGAAAERPAPDARATVLSQMRLPDGSEVALTDWTDKPLFSTADFQTGFTVQVPLFINQGDVIKIDTRTGSYLERSN